MKRLISFLGTTNYKMAKYRFNNSKPVEEQFIQLAIQEIILPKDETVIMTIFMTQKAKETNWDNLLELGLKKRGLNENSEYVIIPEGNSEDEIWELFQIIYDKLGENEQVYCDITHGFRSLPLLSIVLLNYAKIIKNIEIKGIYYGAWEAKDSVTGIAPIFDLSSFANIQDWAIAANQFLRFGSSESISNLANKELIPIIKDNSNKKNLAIKLRRVANLLDRFTNSISSPNGVHIKAAKEAVQIINLINEENLDVIPAFSPILENLTKELSKYNENDIHNGLIAVEWCINNNMTQQGFTILQEYIVSVVAIYNNKNHLRKKDRDDINSAFKIYEKNMPSTSWKVNDFDFVSNLQENLIIKNLSKSFSLLSDRRNRLNHANLRENYNANIEYKKDLTQIFKDVKTNIKDLCS